MDGWSLAGNHLSDGGNGFFSCKWRVLGGGKRQKKSKHSSFSSGDATLTVASRITQSRGDRVCEIHSRLRTSYYFPHCQHCFTSTAAFSPVHCDIIQKKLRPLTGRERSLHFDRRLEGKPAFLFICWLKRAGT